MILIFRLSSSKVVFMGGGSKCPDRFLIAIANFEPPSPQKKVKNEMYSLALNASWG